MTPRLLKCAEAAEYCGLKPRYFKKHIGIAPVRLGPHELWDRQALDTFIDSLQSKARKDSGWNDAVQQF